MRVIEPAGSEPDAPDRGADDLSTRASDLSDREAARRLATLTPREESVCHLVSAGLTNRQIGERLSITPVTVRHHLSSVFSKLEVTNRFELIIFCFRHQQTELPVFGEGSGEASGEASEDS